MADMSSSTNNNTTGLRDLANSGLSFDFAYFCLTESELSSEPYCVVQLHKQEEQNWHKNTRLTIKRKKAVWVGIKEQRTEII